MSRFTDLSSETHYDLVSQASAPSAVVLDVGCGSGETLPRWLHRPDLRLIGVEKLAPERAHAQTRFETRDGDLEQRWPVEDGEADVVSANQVIEHLVVPDGFVSECFRVLRPGGTAVISTENLAAWANIGALLFAQEPFSNTYSKRWIGIGNRFSRRRGQPLDETIPHYSVPSFSALREIFQRAGFRFDEAWGVHVLPLPRSLIRAARRVDVAHSYYITLRFTKPGPAVR